jgi:putative solute:sodium symporter small subunit
MAEHPEEPQAGASPSQNPQKSKPGRSYWSRNLRRLGPLLLLWFFGSYGVSILFVDQLDALSLFGFPLGFWFAQQGSIYIFLLIVVVYIRTMNALDDEFESTSHMPETSDPGGKK